jgi:hypothetical protein
MDLIVAALIAVCLLAVLIAVNLRRRGKHDSQNGADPSNQNKFDTTLGEFRDLRQALRPLQHTRAASRTVPGNRQQSPSGVFRPQRATDTSAPMNRRAHASDRASRES